MKIADRITATLRVAGVAVAAFALAPQAFADGTLAGTSIDYVATVDFEVGGIARHRLSLHPLVTQRPVSGTVSQPRLLLITVVT